MVQRFSVTGQQCYSQARTILYCKENTLRKEENLSTRTVFVRDRISGWTAWEINCLNCLKRGKKLFNYCSARSPDRWSVPSARSGIPYRNSLIYIVQSHQNLLDTA